MVDYSGDPDYLAAFQTMACLATRAGVEGEQLVIHTPIIHMGRADIVREGARLGVDYALTISCYQADADGRACRVCDSYRLNKDGFVAACRRGGGYAIRLNSHKVRAVKH